MSIVVMPRSEQVAQSSVYSELQRYQSSLQATMMPHLANVQPASAPHHNLA